MWRLMILSLLILASCSPEPTPPPKNVQTALSDAQSAVININIFNRDATLNPLPADSEQLFVGEVGERNTVSYTEQIAEQAFISLTDNPSKASTYNWELQATTFIPSSLVIDVTNGSLVANLNNMVVPRFDIVAAESSLEIALPTQPFQLAVDASDSTVNLTIPADAEVQSAQLASNGGLMSLRVGQNVRFIANLSVISGGLTLTVPTSTGVQLIVERAENSEITLPNNPRTIAEAIIYTTPNFEQSTSQILLNSSLNGAAIRIIQEN